VGCGVDEAFGLSRQCVLWGMNLRGQVTKGVRGMSWRWKAKKGVEGCEKPGGAVKRALIPGYPNDRILNP
jgi:hypothetical protein